MHTRRRFIQSFAALAAAPSGLLATVLPARASGVVEILEAELASGYLCAGNEAAIRGTLSRLGHTRPPGAGRTIVVDMPSQHLACYVDGQIELESRVVVGDPGWQTPDLDTSIAFVRFNPTWTVPESILKARSWRQKLANSPEYFSRLDFLVELDGQMVEPIEASARANEVGRFVQQPGAGNALGAVKLGLAAGGAVYLHDTNDPAAFDEESRALSHGCVRVERALDLACWVLGIEVGEGEGLISSDDRSNRSDLPSPVRVVTTYFTAWPAADGAVQYYPDIYGRDAGGAGSCDDQNYSSAWGGDGGVIEELDNSPPAEIVYVQ